jgi:hypothetical protein
MASVHKYPSIPVLAVGIVQPESAIATQPYLEMLLSQKKAPAVIQQRAVGLEIIPTGPSGREVAPVQLNCPSVEVEAPPVSAPRRARRSARMARHWPRFTGERTSPADRPTSGIDEDGSSDQRCRGSSSNGTTDCRSDQPASPSQRTVHRSVSPHSSSRSCPHDPHHRRSSI